jgi:hypothetical protein
VHTDNLPCIGSIPCGHTKIIYNTLECTMFQ